MAKVSYGAGVSQMVNRLGSSVFYRGKHGDVARAWVNPSQTLTAYRTNIRTIYSQIRQDWSLQLTDDMRRHWAELAQQLTNPGKLVNNRHLSGWQLFFQHDFGARQFGLVMDTFDIPTNILVPEPTSFTITTASVAGPNIVLAITWQGPCNEGPDGLYVPIFWGPQTNAGRTCGPIRWQEWDYITLDQVNGIDIGSAWIPTWGAPTIGQRVHVRCKIWNPVNGQPSKWIRTSALWTP